ncbi:hypothetical protein WQ53_11620 [Pseudoxanthomonas suwonensis]|uniref:Class I SAM-dependent methyltransferase n=2 Tax=Pseudoxanthomonas suwonensis TaxID=314722 RepID=A0A0E3UQ30_9GAMM|nr:hypothetical protein WQ53_11620 [Pseudoxanthomonas suwonensis]
MFFRNSPEYWERRYALGGDSGAGSYGESAAYKATALNAFVEAHAIQSVIEFGCGDGNQLTLTRYPRYLGVDVSCSAVERCRSMFERDPTKSFITTREYAGETAQLALSLDVLYHLVEDSIYEDYLRTLFAAGREYVIIYSSSTDQPHHTMRHVMHRPVERDVAQRFPDFKRMHEAEPAPLQVGDSGFDARFFMYRKTPVLLS